MPDNTRFKSAKEYLTTGERPPDGVSVESLPCA